MLKIRVPLSENLNEMKKKNFREDLLGTKYAITKAILKKYKDKIYQKHELKSLEKRKRRASSPLSKSHKVGLSINIMETQKDNKYKSKSTINYWNIERPVDEFKINLISSESLETEEMIDTRDLDIHITQDIDENSNLYHSRGMEPIVVDENRQGVTMIDDKLLNLSKNQGSQHMQRYKIYDGKYSVNYIYLTEIRKILVNSSVLIILKENYEVIKFMKDENKVSDLISLANI